MARKDKNRTLSGTFLGLCVLLCCCRGAFAAVGGGRVTFTISGQVGAPMATLKGLPGDPTSDASGFYTVTVPYGWKGMIRPYKEGWNFKPVSIPINKGLTSSMVDVNFEATEITYTITGNVGMPGVKLIGLPNEPLSDATGTYSATVPHGWAQKVVPYKEGYRFEPADRAYGRILSNRTNQDYVASVIQLEISGSTGQPNVLLKGFPGNIRTDPRGQYNVKVQYGWKGTMVPEKEGCTFIPAERSYEAVRTNQVNQDFQTDVIQFIISGSVGTDGVEMRGLPGTVTSDPSGYFATQVDWGWHGTITPFKEGYTFAPPTLTVPKVLANRDGDNFEAKIRTFTISGSAGVPQVQMYGLPDNPMTTAGGVYRVEVPWGWSGEVTPMLHGYTFTPASQIFEDVKANKTQNFKHEIMTFTVAGTTGVAQAKLKLMQTGNPRPREITSGPDGAYSTTLPFDWQGKIVPEKEGFEFSPPEYEYAGLDGDRLYEHFEASLRKHIISGAIVSERDQKPVEGVTILTEIGSELSAMTDENGEFLLEVEYGWQGQLQPLKPGYTFTPINRPISKVTMDREGQGFSAKVKMLKISGTIIIDNQPVEQVRILTEPDIGETVSGRDGRFSIEVPYGWTGEVRYEKPGFYFEPASEPYSNVTTNMRDGVPEVPAGTATMPTTSTTPPGPTDIAPALEPGTTAIDHSFPPAEIAPDPNGIAGIMRSVDPGTEPPPPTTTDPALEDLRRKIEELQGKLEGGAGAASAPSVGDDGQKRVTYLLEGELIEQLQILAGDFEVTIIPDPTVTALVSVNLVEATLEEALDALLAGTGFAWKKADFYYLVTSTLPTSPGFVEGSVTRRIKLSWVDAKTAIHLLSTAFQPYVQGEGFSTGPAPITAPDTSTSGYSFTPASSVTTAGAAGRTVIVTAPPKLLERIVDDLKQIDKKPQHVFLDARIVVMEKGNLLNMGIEWRWPTLQAGMFRNPPLDVASSTTDVLGNEWPWSMRIGYTADNVFTNALEMAINLMEENGEARVVANPQVMTQDGKLARFGVINEEYYMMVPQLGDAGAFGFSRAELEKIESGTTLSITPYIGDNNDINLEVAVELSDSIPAARGTELPVVTRRQTSNTVAVKDGGTVALAGLTQNRQTSRNKRTPLLSAIPVVGNLFNNNYDDKASREVAVFVTARLIPDTPTAAGRVSETGGPARGPNPGMERPMTEPTYRAPTGDFQMELRDSLLRSRNQSGR